MSERVCPDSLELNWKVCARQIYIFQYTNLIFFSGKEYEGSATTKKEAKKLCAKAVLAGHYNIHY